MPTFSARSLANLKQLHPDLQKVAKAAIKDYDFTILDAQRGRAEQERAFKEGNSKAHFGKSAHNYYPAVAMDICPYPIDWNKIQRFKDLSKVVLAKARELGVELTFGGDWTNLRDYPHYELKNWKQLVKDGAVQLIKD